MKFVIKGFFTLTLFFVLATGTMSLKATEQQPQPYGYSVSWHNINCAFQVCSSCGHHSNFQFLSLGDTQLGPIYGGPCGDDCCYAHAQAKCSFVDGSRGCNKLPGYCPCSDDSDTESIAFSSSGDEGAQMLGAQVCRCCFDRIKLEEKKIKCGDTAQ